ncbi:MAG TPA: phosphoribosyltransferase family protein [Nitrososphaeraceae archaeon]|nr:phosphoribosyltransferase family protein [Nitrososphaeraceae archaeon]
MPRTTDLNLKKNDYLDWNNIENLVKKTALKIKENNKKYDLIIGIKSGGIIPAKLISRELNINNIDFISVKMNQIFTSSNFPRNKKYLLIDDIYDTGKTFFTVNKFFNSFDFDYACLVSRYRITDNNSKIIIIGEILNHNKWIVFPWENG